MDGSRYIQCVSTPEGWIIRYNPNCLCNLCQAYPALVIPTYTSLQIGYYDSQSGAPHAQAPTGDYFIQELQSNHRTTSEASTRVQCTHCSKTFTRKRDMERHVSTIHTTKDSLKYHCHHPACMRSAHGTGYPRRDARDDHEKNKCELMKKEPWYALRDPRERPFPRGE